MCISHDVPPSLISTSAPAAPAHYSDDPIATANGHDYTRLVTKQSVGDDKTSTVDNYKADVFKARETLINELPGKFLQIDKGKIYPLFKIL